jgi:hypothetical protein
VNGCSRPTRLAWSAAAIVATAAACGDFAHTNPLDPATRVELSLVGPDSAFSIGDTLRFTIASDPAYTPAIVEWSYRPPQMDPFRLRPIAPGVVVIEQTFNRVDPAAAPVMTVTATVDGRAASKTVSFVHRAVSFRLYDCQKRTTPMLEFASLRETRSVCTQLLDRRGNVMLLTTRPAAVSRSSGIATASSGVNPAYNPDVVLVTSATNGETQLVATYAGLTDSMAVRVRQVVAHVDLQPSGCQTPEGIEVAVGQSVQLVPTGVGFDAMGFAVADTAAIRAAGQAMQFAVLGWLDIATVTPSGLVTGVLPGFAYMYGSAGPPGSEPFIGYCRVVVR